MLEKERRRRQRERVFSCPMCGLEAQVSKAYNPDGEPLPERPPCSHDAQRQDAGSSFWRGMVNDFSAIYGDQPNENKGENLHA